MIIKEAFFQLKIICFAQIVTRVNLMQFMLNIDGVQYVDLKITIWLMSLEIAKRF